MFYHHISHEKCYLMKQTMFRQTYVYIYQNNGVMTTSKQGCSQLVLVLAGAVNKKTRSVSCPFADFNIETGTHGDAARVAGCFTPLWRANTGTNWRPNGQVWGCQLISPAPQDELMGEIDEGEGLALDPVMRELLLDYYIPYIPVWVRMEVKSTQSRCWTCLSGTDTSPTAERGCSTRWGCRAHVRLCCRQSWWFKINVEFIDLLKITIQDR